LLICSRAALLSIHRQISRRPAKKLLRSH
jgi:hypothetical protein